MHIHSYCTYNYVVIYVSIYEIVILLQNYVNILWGIQKVTAIAIFY